MIYTKDVRIGAVPPPADPIGGLVNVYNVHPATTTINGGTGGMKTIFIHFILSILL